MRKRVAVVTGASRGIGKAIAISLARKGFIIVINYNESQKEAINTLNEVKKVSDGIIIKADVSNMVEVKKMVEDISQKYGTIDVLVNNAGVIIRP